MYFTRNTLCYQCLQLVGFHFFIRIFCGVSLCFSTSPFPLCWADSSLSCHLIVIKHKSTIHITHYYLIKVNKIGLGLIPYGSLFPGLGWFSLCDCWTVQEYLTIKSVQLCSFFGLVFLDGLAS